MSDEEKDVVSDIDTNIIYDMNLLYSDFAVAQSEFPKIDKEATNPFFKSKYITLDKMIAVIRPILSRHNLGFIQELTHESGAVGVKTVLFHKQGGKMDSGTFYIKPAKQDPQGYGSAATYAKRYSFSAFFGISCEDDDDDNAAQGKDDKAVSKPKKPTNALANDKQLAGFVAWCLESGYAANEELEKKIEAKTATFAELEEESFKIKGKMAVEEAGR